MGKRLIQKTELSVDGNRVVEHLRDEDGVLGVYVRITSYTVREEDLHDGAVDAKTGDIRMVVHGYTVVDESTVDLPYHKVKLTNVGHVVPRTALMNIFGYKAVEAVLRKYGVA